MLIEWLGHASFRLTLSDGTSVVTDPFDGTVGYSKPTRPADVVTVSHDHYDHNAAAALNPKTVYKTAGRFPGKVDITGYPSFHDDRRGAKRGANIMFLIEADGARVLHLGDLGHDLSDEEIARFGRVDALLIPVGGIYTIDARQAAALAKRIGARVTVPMHYKTPRLAFELGTDEPFLAAMGGEYAQCKALDPLHSPASVAVMTFGEGLE